MSRSDYSPCVSTTILQVNSLDHQQLLTKLFLVVSVQFGALFQRQLRPCGLNLNTELEFHHFLYLIIGVQIYYVLFSVQDLTMLTENIIVAALPTEIKAI
jgi:hypothetical protein